MNESQAISLVQQADRLAGRRDDPIATILAHRHYERVRQYHRELRAIDPNSELAQRLQAILPRGYRV